MVATIHTLVTQILFQNFAQANITYLLSRKCKNLVCCFFPQDKVYCVCAAAIVTVISDFFFIILLVPHSSSLVSLSLSLSPPSGFNMSFWPKAHSSEYSQSHIFIPAKHTSHSSHTLTLTSHTLPSWGTLSIKVYKELVKWNNFHLFTRAFHAIEFTSLIVCILLFSCLFISIIIIIILCTCLFNLILSVLIVLMSYHIYACNLYIYGVQDATIHNTLKRCGSLIVWLNVFERFLLLIKVAFIWLKIQ